MQTFLPYPDFGQSAHCLDYKRLGKQRVEAMQILLALRDKSYGWQNHPVVNMWRGHEDCLSMYLRETILEWKTRGYRNNMEIPKWRIALPPLWLGDREFHRRHRAALLMKDPKWYGQFGWRVKPRIDYKWPTSQRGELQ